VRSLGLGSVVASPLCHCSNLHRSDARDLELLAAMADDDDLPRA